MIAFGACREQNLFSVINILEEIGERAAYRK
jgi:hypothetical protein